MILLGFCVERVPKAGVVENDAWWRCERGILPACSFAAIAGRSNGECYEYWTLVETVRTAKGPHQEIVATLGKEPGLESRTRHGWEQVADLLESRTWLLARPLTGLQAGQHRLGRHAGGIAHRLRNLCREHGDVTTVEEMVELMEDKYGQAQRIWVMERGMISEDNFDFLRSRQTRCLVGTPKSQLKAFAAQLLEQEYWTQVQVGVDVKLVAHPDGGTDEQYVLCRSSARREKEAAMIQLARQCLRAQLDKTHLADFGRTHPRSTERWVGHDTSGNLLR